jgi:tRNA(Ile)-lysidine synthase TilS/MesJ
MNDRIRLLAEQAGIKLPDDSAYNGHIFRNSIERFANLLEKDIEAQHFSAGYRAGQSDGIKDTVEQCLFLCDQVDLAGADDCIDRIRDHFGVE